MTDEIKEQVERENVDLGERPYRTIPEAGKPLMSYDFKKGDYGIYITYEEGLSGLEKVNQENNPRYFQKGVLRLSSLKSKFNLLDFFREEYYASLYGSGIKMGTYDFNNTRQASEDFAREAHEYLKSREIWLDPEKIASFVYDALEPVRKRRKELSELVMGVDFQLENQGGMK